jgi:hypothetical protein
MDTARVAYALEAERKELFRHMIHDEVNGSMNFWWVLIKTANLPLWS